MRISKEKNARKRPCDRRVLRQFQEEQQSQGRLQKSRKMDEWEDTDKSVASKQTFLTDT